MNEFARRLKEARKEAHLTQDELANRLNVSKSTISMWENGNRIPSINITIPLSRVLNKPPSFFTGDSVRVNKDGSAAPGIAYVVHNEDNDIFIEAYHSLNEEGFNRLMEYAKFLMSSEKYRKD